MRTLSILVESQTRRDFPAIRRATIVIKSREQDHGTPVAQKKVDELLLGNGRPAILFSILLCTPAVLHG